MSVAFDLDSLLVSPPMPDNLPRTAPHADPQRRPSLRLVPCEPVPVPVPVAPAGVPDGRASVSVLHAPSAGALAAPLRLTRRGVAVLAVLTAVAGALLVWAALRSAPAATPAGSAQAVPATVTVRSGDTLWAVATRVAPGRDPRAEVAQLRHLNHLADPGVWPGQVLRVR